MLYNVRSNNDLAVDFTVQKRRKPGIFSNVNKPISNVNKPDA